MSNEDFQGFEPSNTTPVPDVLFDQLLPELSGAELKVLLYIIRRTRGFKKETDAISFNQFLYGITTKDGRVLDKGCGIKDRTTLSRTLAALEKRNCIQSQKSETKKHEKEVTTYGIKFKSGQEVVGKSYQGSREIIPPVVGKDDYRSRENPLEVVGKSYPQETVIQQTDLQQTEERENAHADALPDMVADASAIRNEPIPLFSSDTLVQTEQHADVPIVKATNETNVPVDVATGNATTQPTRSRRRSSSKKRVDLDAIPLQERPPRPEREMPWSPRKLLLWGDYFRGYRLQESNQKNSYYQRAQQAAVNIVGRKITEANYVAIHRFMLGVKVTLEDDPTFRDDWWPENKVADVWNVEQHATEMARKIKAKKSHLHPVASPPQPEQTQPIELGGYRTFIPDDDDEVQYVTRRNSPTKLAGGTR